MNLTIDTTNLFAHEKMTAGLSPQQIQSAQGLIDRAWSLFRLKKHTDPLGFYDLPDRDISHITDYIQSIEHKYEAMVVLGIGGSALGNKAVYSALKAQKPLKKLYVYDNVDPSLWAEILANINPEKTIFNCITKSGTTAETMATFMFVIDYLKEKFPTDYAQRMIITTDEKKGFMRHIVNTEGYHAFIVPDDVGGRFSVLTDVGLVSSAFVGVDIQGLLYGARKMRTHCDIVDEPLKNPAMTIALTHVLYMQQGKNISVMMPYSNALYDMADWYRQLWAESLGKKTDFAGQTVNVGQTPVKALGATDQHSQVQLYAEGPADKVFTFMMVDKHAVDYTIPMIYTDRPEVNYLCDRTFSSLLNAECLATELALTESGSPNMTIKFADISGENIGAFIYLYEAATVFAGYMLNIDPLDQPGVEAGKIATYALMDKKGFEEKKLQIVNYTLDKQKKGGILCLN